MKNLYDNKRYYQYSHYLKKKFNRRISTVPINLDFTCPNRDGSKSTSGCIFCSAEGSGDFSVSGLDNITLKKDFIIYLQSYSNTYSTIENLRYIYYKALSVEGMVGLSIATRVDCITDEIIDLLEEINNKTFLTVELGLQTIHKKSHETINSQFDITDFELAYKKLKHKNIRVVVHLIFGLPNETYNDMVQTVKYVSNLKVSGVKLQLLYVLKNTELAKMYDNNNYTPLTKDEYIKIIADSIEYLDKNIVIHRLTGDGKKEDLIAPLYSLNKLDILNSIDKELKVRNSYQGINNKNNF